MFTDGDLRRTLDRDIDVRNAIIDSVMTTHGKTARPEMLAAEALKRLGFDRPLSLAGGYLQWTADGGSVEGA